MFRRHVGAALIARGGLLESWLDRQGPRPGWAGQEAQIEEAVSERIGIMPFLWLSVPGQADRDYLEHIALA